MLRITQNTSAESACKYFDQSLVTSDYYGEKGQIIGLWGGRGAAALGLSGEVQKEAFHKLCHNINPQTDQRLTARNDANRTTGYDWTLSVPKSVSIIHSQTGDQDILTALNTAVHYAMSEAEKDAETRVRKKGKSENRTTGNLVWAAFTHTDARPVDGVPDPHLHTHCFVFNATWDAQEKMWKAGQFRNLKAEAPYYEALFHNRLAFELQKAGYRIERNERDFEIAGFKRSTVDKFSRRTLEVNEKIKEMGLEYADDKAKIGARTRANKRSGLDKKSLKKEWTSRLNSEELKLIHEAKNKSRAGGDIQKNSAASDALNYALAHGLERKSVIHHNELMTLSLKNSMGRASKEEIETEINSRKDLLSKEAAKRKIYTSKAALEEEQKLIKLTRAGLNQFKELHKDYVPQNPLLNKEQKDAVRHALQSKDFITVITGGAGTGKTWSMQEIAKAVTEKQSGFHAFAPSATASRDVQREEGFDNATTIADLLQNAKLQSEIKKGDMLWLDEAGQIGCKTLNDVIALAKKQNARLLLTGDTRQHTGVERGDALKILTKFGGIKPAYINTIQRQKKEIYKEAVKALSEGHIEKAYNTLDHMGALKDGGSFDAAVNALAGEYVEAIKKKETVLVVSTTHNQGKILTSCIREGLKKEGKLAKKDRQFDTQVSLSFTEAQKKDKANYVVGQSVQLHQNIKGFRRGERLNIIGIDEDGSVIVDQNGKNKILPLPEAKKFTVYQNTKTPIAKNDLIRITQNGFSLEKKRLNNGAILTVTGFDEQGNIKATTGRAEITIDKNYGNLGHGYYTTSQGSQGKSVNRVLVLQTAQSGKAANKEQFYVSVSRGKFEISIHTDNKQKLLDSVQKTSARVSAMEIFSPAKEKGRLMAVKDKLQKMGEVARTQVTEASQAIKDGIRKNITEVRRDGPSHSR